ncbi:hypothetical protein CLMAG_12850 [Clostridium magnum DSM 2767]|uniref:Uncharacterized protein n=1 Tax=Clostridium magnum DSM 2767 TaxID=1121326 RepID=A0A161YT15_9CLOT|nr:hypothetical protein CLMAG_12850 [Clostridium magnum DSM 2767]SHH92253.1 hypothetical protein SAMN02745944_01768 [Clostridium magnum DSM 2767]
MNKKTFLNTRITFNDILLNKEGDNMIIDLEIEEIKNIENLIISRINDLRDKLTDDTDKEEELKEIIRDYKRIVQKIDEQLSINK